MQFNTSIQISSGISKILPFRSFWSLSGAGFRPHKFVLFILSFCFLTIAQAQDLNYAKKIVKKLSSAEFHGRGYVKNGDAKAAAFLRTEMQELGVAPLVKNYFQDYIFPVNVFPKRTDLLINNKLLKPGFDFCIKPNSPSISGKFDLVKMDTAAFYASGSFGNKFALLDTAGWGKQWQKFVQHNKRALPYKGIVQVTYKTPSTAVSMTQGITVTLYVYHKAIPENPTSISLNIETTNVVHKASNVLGTVKGEIDTFVVFTAHYDHLGGMGKKVYFPGANDNASGTAMVLNLAKELAKTGSNKYSYAFMLFSGEEAGLLGSEYYTLNPAFPLNKIKMVINLDMVGTGADGISVFNATANPKEFAAMDSLNKTLGLNLSLKAKSPSQGSDHFSFHKRGVKALFVLTEDKNAPYHTVTDTFESLSFEAYERLYKLINAYIKSL
ncbi:MAG TPA: M28 family peptidase [Bacteroidales bacterium]|nr:M28 family peptidase [Bacteroidales bacterium]